MLFECIIYYLSFTLFTNLIRGSFTCIYYNTKWDRVDDRDLGPTLGGLEDTTDGQKSHKFGK